MKINVDLRIAGAMIYEGTILEDRIVFNIKNDEYLYDIDDRNMAYLFVPRTDFI